MSKPSIHENIMKLLHDLDSPHHDTNIQKTLNYMDDDFNSSRLRAEIDVSAKQNLFSP